MWAGRGPALRDRTVVDAAGQPVRRRTRHCWVTGPPEDPGEREGLVVAWLHSEPGGWRALVVYVLAPDGAGVEASTVVHAWVPAAQLRAAPA